MSDFNSQEWFSHFKRMADKFYHYSEQEFVLYDENVIDTIMHRYETRLPLIKKEMFGEDITPDNKIDRHKITALYIQLFLENPIFKIMSNKVDPIYPASKTLLINEFFCLNIIRSVFRKWHNSALVLDEFNKYKVDFILLLSYYRKNHTKIDKISPHFHFTHALANVIFFIEQNFSRSS